MDRSSPCVVRPRATRGNVVPRAGRLVSRWDCRPSGSPRHWLTHPPAAEASQDSTVRDQLMASQVSRIVSGGQAGVDRAALVVGRRAGITVGGWCPVDGAAEDLLEPPGVLALFPELRPTPSADPRQRT